MARTVYIYALEDPEAGDVRYVGRSVAPHLRYFAHLSAATNALMATWIRELRQRGLKPRMIILEKTDSCQCDDAEKRWIEFYKTRSDLLNVTGVRASTYDSCANSIGTIYPVTYSTYSTDPNTGRIVEKRRLRFKARFSKPEDS